MVHQLSLSKLTNILDLTDTNFPHKFPNNTVTGISTDSRQSSPGQIFIALRGDKFDGHDFAQMAVDNGAIALVLDHPISIISPNIIPQFVVKDTLKSYQTIAQKWRENFPIPVIAVTGSVGKTTTKELIATILSTQGNVHKTQANYNNEIGVPKTLLDLNESHDYAVIEMAMRARGEIALLTEIASPTIGAITNVGTAHIGRLGSEEAIAQAKCELLEYMPTSSIALLNADNPMLMKTAKTVWQGETLTYGLDNGDICGELIDSQTLRVQGLDFPLPLPGRHNALNYLAALSVAKVLNIDWIPLTQGLSVNLPGGRARRYSLANDIVVLDETYNAGLESMVAAVVMLSETPGKRHIAVLGTMKELGERSPEFHRLVGEKVRQLGIDRLFVLIQDPETEEIALGASGVPTECFNTHSELVERLKEVVQSGDRLLFKASNSVGLSQVVEKFRGLVAGG